MREEAAAPPRRKRRLRRRFGRRAVAIIRKLRVLGRIVPGCGEAEETADLLRRTAEYISLLEVQVRILKSFADLYGV